MGIAQRIKSQREARGISQSELAREVGVTAQSVQQWESGATTPRQHRVEAIARVLACNAIWLTTGYGAENTDPITRPRAPDSDGHGAAVSLDVDLIEYILEVIEYRRAQNNHGAIAPRDLARTIVEAYTDIQRTQDAARLARERAVKNAIDHNTHG